MMKHHIFLVTLIATLSACNDPGPTQLANVAVSFAAQAPVNAPALDQGGQAPSAAALLLTSASLVLREIELERVDVADCVGEQDGCEKFEAGPVLVSLPLDGSVSSQFELDIPEGSYDEIEFDIHKISIDAPEEAAFRAAHPEFIGLSIRVEGTYDGVSFVFETDLDVEQELNLSPVLVVGAGSMPTNITVAVGLDGWFRDESGALVNPATGNKGEPNESIIKENIKVSIEAFEDVDRDGQGG
jgi:hypothetical protein